MDISRVDDAYYVAARVRKILKEAKLEFEKNHDNYEEKINALEDKFLEELDCNNLYEFGKKFEDHEFDFHRDSNKEVLDILELIDSDLIEKISNLDYDCFNIIRMTDLKGDKAW